jgi:hypothetical protein
VLKVLSLASVVLLFKIYSFNYDVSFQFLTANFPLFAAARA